MRSVGIGSGGAAGAQALTPRQMQVFELLTRGFSNGAIAQRLGITLGTAKLHVAAILRAYAAKGRVDLVVRRVSGMLSETYGEGNADNNATMASYPHAARHGERESE